MKTLWLVSPVIILLRPLSAPSDGTHALNSGIHTPINGHSEFSRRSGVLEYGTSITSVLRAGILIMLLLRIRRELRDRVQLLRELHFRIWASHFMTNRLGSSTTTLYRLLSRAERA